MPKYIVKGTNAAGDEVRETVEADSTEEAVGMLKFEEINVHSISLAEKADSGFRRRAVSHEDFALFNAQLAAMIETEIPLPTALRHLSKESRSRRFRKALEDVTQRLECGESLDVAMAARRDAFPELYRAMAAAGVASGNLPDTLRLVSSQYSSLAKLRGRMIEAMIYPVSLLCLAVLIMVPICVKIIPRFEEMFVELNIALPAPTIFVLSFGAPGPTLPRIILGVLGIGIIGYVIMRIAPGGRHVLDRIKRHIPFLGRLHRSMVLCRICHTIGGLISSNTPLPVGLELAARSCGNQVYAGALLLMKRRVEEGFTIADGFSEAGEAFPESMLWLTALGERRGNLAEVLNDLGRIYSSDAERTSRMTRFLSPAIFVLPVVLFIVFLVIALFMPLIKLMGSMG